MSNNTTNIVSLNAHFCGTDMLDISVARLREMLSYDPETGALTWRQRPANNSRRRAGDVAGTIKEMRGKSYRYVTIDGIEMTAVQAIWAISHGEFPNARITALNGDGTDLRLVNLREMATCDGEFDFSTAAGHAEYLRAHRAANRDHYREKDLKRTFGIDLAEYQRMFVEQKGVCGVCRKPELSKRNGKTKWLAVDHDHVTGQVRGLLCGKCNPMIGYADEDQDVLLAAAEYLKKYVRPDNVVPMTKKEA